MWICEGIGVIPSNWFDIIQFLLLPDLDQIQWNILPNSTEVKIPVSNECKMYNCWLLLIILGRFLTLDFFNQQGIYQKWLWLKMSKKDFLFSSKCLFFKSFYLKNCTEHLCITQISGKGAKHFGFIFWIMMIERHFRALCMSTDKLICASVN